MKRTKKVYRISAHIVRAALLLAALAALSSLWLWTARPGLVESLDNRIFSLYTSSYTKRYDHAAALVREGRTKEGREAFEKLLDGLGAVRKQERLSRASSAVLKTLITLYRREGDNARALHLSKKLVELDGNDYAYRLEHARTLLANGMDKEAIDELYAAFRIAPQSLEAAEALTDTLLRSGRKEEAKEAARGFLEANRGGNMTLYYAGGEDPAPKEAGRLAGAGFTGRPQSFVIPVNARGVSRLMFAFNSLMDTEIRIVSLTAHTGRGKVRIDPASVDFGTENLRPVGPYAWAAAAGKDPAIYFNLPLELRGEALAAFELEAAFSAHMPEGLSGLLEG